MFRRQRRVSVSRNIESRFGERRSVTSRMWLVVVAGIVAGCGDSGTTKVVRPNRPDDSPSKSHGTLRNDSAVASRMSQPVDLVEANWNELQSFVADQKGKIVVVDVWSTSCEPCIKEFPNLIALHKKYSDDVVAIAFNVDYVGIKNKPPEYYRERVLKFLKSQPENGVRHRMCHTPADELFTEIKLDSIPAIYVYGVDGVLAKRFSGSNGQGDDLSYEKQVVPFVEALLKK